MTTRLDFVSTDLINCLICIRQFDTLTRKPKILQCGHSLCEECAKTLTEPRMPLTIRCPTCRVFMTRPGAQQFVTNFQIMGFLAEKEKREKEEREKGVKTDRDVEEYLQFKIKRSKNLKVLVAAKKDLEKPEMYIRKDGDGETTLVVAGKTGMPDEIVNYINESGIKIERGTLVTRVVHDEGRAKISEQFVKVDNVVAGQSAMKIAAAPAKLEESEFVESYELKAVEEDGKNLFELVRVEVPEDGKQVFGGSMSRPSVKRQKQSPSNMPSTSDAVEPEGPISKRTRRGRGK